MFKHADVCSSLRNCNSLTYCFACCCSLVFCTPASVLQLVQPCLLCSQDELLDAYFKTIILAVCSDTIQIDVFWIKQSFALLRCSLSHSTLWLQIRFGTDNSGTSITPNYRGKPEYFTTHDSPSTLAPINEGGCGFAFILISISSSSSTRTWVPRLASQEELSSRNSSLREIILNRTQSKWTKILPLGFHLLFYCCCVLNRNVNHNPRKLKAINSSRSHSVIFLPSMRHYRATSLEGCFSNKLFAR